jgi:hypothetical protein
VASIQWEVWSGKWEAIEIMAATAARQGHQFHRQAISNKILTKDLNKI